MADGSLDVLKQDATATWTIDLSDAQFVNNVKGDTDFVETDRFPKTMNWFCRDLFKLKK
ncbi:MAG: hypothetical protein J6Y32_07825 [Bacteroidales bacterium]|nr:hypothetical protein [Bacteroidales bacterium]